MTPPLPPSAALAAAGFDVDRLVGLVVIVLVLQAIKRAAAMRRKRTAEEASKERRAERVGRADPGAAPPAPARPAPAPAPAASRKPLLSRAPDMAPQGADHPSRHEHLADLSARALKTDPHPGHLTSEKHPGHLESEKHPGAHPSTVSRASRGPVGGRALLLGTSLRGVDRVRAAVLWHEVLVRRRPMVVPPRRPTSSHAASA